MACEAPVTLDEIRRKAGLSNYSWVREHVELLAEAGFLRVEKAKDSSPVFQITDKGHYFRPYLAELIKAKSSKNLR
jgi:predicted transcriptional regulator